MLDALEALTQPAAFTSQPAPSGWQPIESSPKDGTVFYINHPRGVRRAWWCGDGERLYYEAPGRGEMVDDPIAHWMPLPEVKDAITDAVRAELEPLADALIDAGHKLAKGMDDER